jgi:UDP-GlcNAc3NAcA epimerase
MPAPGRGTALKIVTVVGARPQFVKASAVSHALRSRNAAGARFEEILVHTGQHFDPGMSQVFFDELDIPAPAHHLGIGGLTHGAMTGRMIERIEELLLAERPDWVLVYGDTNSTLAGALAAAKLRLPIAHVEAGLRSYNNAMPEEINRALVDRVATALFCPGAQAAENLRKESVPGAIHVVGDVMYDAILRHREAALKRVSLAPWGLAERGYALCTVHRAENTESAERFAGIWRALREIGRSLPVVLPAHPRLRELIARSEPSDGIRVIPPVSYLEMIRLEASAQSILTDSGGVQKEAFFLGVPCLTLREETEWVETVALGANVLCGAAPQRILAAWSPALKPAPARSNPYGDGRAAEKILQHLESS